MKTLCSDLKKKKDFCYYRNDTGSLEEIRICTKQEIKVSKIESYYISFLQPVPNCSWVDIFLSVIFHFCVIKNDYSMVLLRLSILLKL